MSSQGPLFPQTTVDNSGVGTFAWVNPNNAQAEDGVVTTSQSLSSSGANSKTHYLLCTNFGFSIPNNATITGILAEIKKKTTQGNIQDSIVSVIKSNGSIGSTNKAILTNWVAFTLTYASYGNSSDLWGETWTPADINNSNFGLAISATLVVANVNIANIDDVRITVSYTLPATGGLLNFT